MKLEDKIAVFSRRLRRAASIGALAALPYAAGADSPISRPEGGQHIRDVFYEVFTPESTINTGPGNAGISWVGPNPDFGVPGGYNPANNIVQLSGISAYARADQVHVLPELGDCSTGSFGTLLVNYDDQTPIFVTSGGDSVRLFSYLGGRYGEDVRYRDIHLKAIPATDSPDTLRARARDIFMRRIDCNVAVDNTTWGGLKQRYR